MIDVSSRSTLQYPSRCSQTLHCSSAHRHKQQSEPSPRPKGTERRPSRSLRWTPTHGSWNCGQLHSSGGSSPSWGAGIQSPGCIWRPDSLCLVPLNLRLPPPSWMIPCPNSLLLCMGFGLCLHVPPNAPAPYSCLCGWWAHRSLGPHHWFGQCKSCQHILFYSFLFLRAFRWETDQTSICKSSCADS